MNHQVRSEPIGPDGNPSANARNDGHSPPTHSPSEETPGKLLSGEQQKRFHDLVRIWRKEISHLSSVSQLARHPAYREIINMGQPVVPLLLVELRRKPDHWFVALHTITGANPVPPESEGRLAAMTQAWLQWGKEKGYIE